MTFLSTVHMLNLRKLFSVLSILHIYALQFTVTPNASTDTAVDQTSALATLDGQGLCVN